MSALEVKLDKVDSLISEIQSLKQETNSPKKPDYSYLRAAFRNRTDSTAGNRNSKERKNEKLKAMKMCLRAKSHKTENQKLSKWAQIIVIRRQLAQLKDHRKNRISTLVV